MTKDPIRFAGDGENLYAYAGNDPINSYDVNGLQRGGAIPGRTNNHNPALNNRNTFNNRLNNSTITPRPVPIKPLELGETRAGAYIKLAEEFVQNPCMFARGTCGQDDSICVAWSCSGIPHDTSNIKNPIIFQGCKTSDSPPFMIGGENDKPSISGPNGPSFDYLNNNGCTCVAIKLL